MTRNLLCAVYLLIALSSVHSASYFYRAGREIIVPAVDEVKEVISELKKDGPIVLEEVVAIVPENVEPVVPAVAVKSVPDSVVENNVVAVDVIAPVVAPVVAPSVVPSEVVVSDEARSKPNPTIRLDTLEVIQPGNEKSDKVQTVAETVKIAAVQAIEKQNEEVEKAKPVEPVADVKETKAAEVPAVKSSEVPVVPVAPVDTVKSVEPVVPVVKDEKIVAPVEVVKEVESVRSADPEPPKPDVVKDEKIEEVVDEKVVEPEVLEKATQEIEKGEKPPVRQDTGAQPAPANPIASLTNALTQFQQQVQNTFTSAINSIVPPGLRPQSDVPVPAAGGLNTNEIASNAAVPTQVALAPTTAAPNLVQNIQNAFANIFPRPTSAPAQAQAAAPVASQTGTRGDQIAQGVATQAPATSSPNIIANLASNVQNAISQITNIFPRPTTVAPVAVAAASPGPNIVKGTRGDEDEVEVVQNIDIVNDKVDLAKKKKQ